MINVTKPFLPDYSVYENYLKGIWERNWLTNNGPLVRQLEEKLKAFLDVKHLFFCTNGTIALQIAIKALNLTGEIITTPFSYVATTGSIIWEGCTPVFADIKTSDYNIDPAKIEAAITKDTSAILATHVYGNPCDVDEIKRIADKYNLKIIYDGAHAFSSTLNGKQVLSFGDISTCSFHATKLFHTIEGGCIITESDELAETIMLYRQFGHINDDYYSIGVNGKNSEFHAAMGLSVLPEVKSIIKGRAEASSIYDKELEGLNLEKPVALAGTSYNYGYYPVVFQSEEILLQIKRDLETNGIAGRRYFYPSLNELSYIQYQPCPVSEKISKSVFALPLYYDMDPEVIRKITGILRKNLIS